ncbi:hypothetical protein ACFYE2_03120 [Kocuria sp. CPCC 205300]|uniref:hypothetical protein n=1 Tax=Kocuria sabuli TaxID=3071448 RepID=UPI0036DB6C4B
MPDRAPATAGTTTHEEPAAQTTTRTTRRTMNAATLLACAVVLRRIELITGSLLVTPVGVGRDVRRTEELARGCVGS